MSDLDANLLWSPSALQVEQAELTGFARFFMEKLNLPPPENYAQLHSASIRHAGVFWRSVWEYCGLVGQSGTTDYLAGESFRDGKWFPEATLNFAENLLHPEKLNQQAFASAPALICWTEDGPTRTWNRQELFEDVRSLACYLFSHGIVAGDRIVGVLPNIGEAVVAMLATTSLGAIWSTCSPDFGDDAICDRFGQIQPRILLTSLQSTYNGKPVRSMDRVLPLLNRLPTIEQTIVVGLNQPPSLRTQESNAATSLDLSSTVIAWDSAVQNGYRTLESVPEVFDAAFLKPLPFQHPLVVVYSSGTTGIPKCMVHGAGGSLVQHVKEHRLHCDLRPLDRLFYYTTTGWMMWNWLTSGLATQAAVVLYDGSPFADGPETLWQMASQIQVTHFGAGARFYSTIEKQNYRPAVHQDLRSIRCVLSTGSPLMPTTYDWMYQALGPNFNLASISGGTDLLSCFVLGNPTLPVRSGQIQCKGLGMDVHVFDENGKKIVNRPGELVCKSPFPSMPVEFWNDPDGVKYQQAYFDRFPECWCHGDWAEETLDGSFIIYGRSDATLNPGGVRIGTAEIYQQLESFPEIAECVATGLRHDGDEQIVLFIRVMNGYDFDVHLVERIRHRLRNHCSPRHVPAFIDWAPDFPRTISGKLSEIAVRSAISGTSLGNTGALANPDSLTFFKNWKPGQ